MMTHGTPMVSMIVPVYNGGCYLQQCIDSVLRQTFSDLELILVDDGSTDESGDICDRAAQTDARVRVIHKQNEGLIATWIRGVKESRGRYLGFLDCDDWLSLDHLEKMTGQLRMKENAGNEKDRQIICGGYVIEREWNHTSEKKENALAPGVYEGEALQRQVREHLLGNEERTLILSRCMKLFSRCLLEDNLHFCDPSIRMGEDVSITVPAILDAERVVVLENNYDYHYRFVKNSMAHGHDAGMYDNILLLRKILHRVMADKRMPNGAMQVEREFVFLLCLVLKIEMRRTDASGKEVAECVQQICRKSDSADRTGKLGMKVHDPANRLLIFVMQNPQKSRIRLVRSIFLLQQRKSERA
jgi:glycosyltransferase involved in cell wall biosynthesis